MPKSSTLSLAMRGKPKDNGGSAPLSPRSPRSPEMPDKFDYAAPNAAFTICRNHQPRPNLAKTPRASSPTSPPTSHPRASTTAKGHSSRQLHEQQSSPTLYSNGRSGASTPDLGRPVRTPNSDGSGSRAKLNKVPPAQLSPDVAGSWTTNGDGTPLKPTTMDKGQSWRQMGMGKMRTHSTERQEAPKPIPQNDDAGSRRDKSEQLSVASNSFNETKGHGFISKLGSGARNMGEKMDSARKGVFRQACTKFEQPRDPDARNERAICLQDHTQATNRTDETDQNIHRLEQSRDKTEFWMPALPWRCIDYLNMRGCEEEGLYRVPGSAQQVRYYERKFDEVTNDAIDRDIDLISDPNLNDPNVIGSLFKNWLRQLPQMKSSRKRSRLPSNKNAKAQTTTPQMLKDELSKLPPFNYYLFFNKMNYNNLCICFQPAIKIDAFCFQFLILDWRNCWQGCWTEKDFLTEEINFLNSLEAENQQQQQLQQQQQQQQQQQTSSKNGQSKSKGGNSSSNQKPSTKRSQSTDYIKPSSRGISSDRNGRATPPNPPPVLSEPASNPMSPERLTSSSDSREGVPHKRGVPRAPPSVSTEASSVDLDENTTPTQANHMREHSESTQFRLDLRDPPGSPFNINLRDQRVVYLLPLTDYGHTRRSRHVHLPAPRQPIPHTRFASNSGYQLNMSEGSLWVNIPAKGDKFKRSNYREYKLQPNFTGMCEIEIPVYEANAFSFYTTYTPLPEWSFTDVTSPEPTRTDTYYIDICPSLELHGQHLPVEAVCIFSCLSKFMGNYPTDWDNHLRGISEPYMISSHSTIAIFKNGEKDIADLVRKMHDKFNLLAMTDVVWNHTANNSKWLEEHPESGYNVDTAPHLRPALELDTALLQFGKELKEHGLPTTFESEADLLKVMQGVKDHVLSKLQLWQFYVVDVDRDTKAIMQAWTSGQVNFVDASFSEAGPSGLDAVRDWPLKQKADCLLCALFGRYDTSTSNTPDDRAAQGTITAILNEVNLPFYREYDGDQAEILEQLFNRIKYVRIDAHGPKLGEVNDKNPLIETYFTRLPLNATTKKHNPEALALVNNGWVWAADAMRDNAGPKSRAYLRREVIVWGDCVKLRYGTGPEDNPFLWDHMAKYTRLMAKYFQGFRIDNCHSTPLHLAEYMLDQARSVNSNIMVCAELFTGSEEMDYKFCMKLGICALIREAMQAWSTQELSRLVHRHGGVPIGSFETDEVLNAAHATDGADTSKPIIKKIKRSPVHALFMDCTHDNETPAQKRDARDTLPTAALVAMCDCATGSVFGFDEVYPELIELVHEKRLYSSANSTGAPIKPQAGEGGIGGIRKIINEIHVKMGKEEYNETYIHHDNEYITVHRVNPHTRKGYFLIAHTAFPGYVDNSPETRASVVGDKATLRGLPSKTNDLEGVKIELAGDETTISIPEKFPPGSIALFETWVPSAEHADGLDKFVTSGAKAAFSGVNLTDLNYILYRCEEEERDATDHKDGTYNIPEHGNLVYAGLQGWWSVLRDIVNDNNLGHPLCNHLREGQWALDYCLGRLQKISEKENYANIKGPAEWLKSKFDAIRKVPNFMLPRYFALVIQTAYNAAVERAIELMGENVREGNQFLKSLALVSCQVTGYMNSASLWPDKSVPSMAAGLPHFAYDWARCWGRDITISARGLYMGTESVLKHGMVPNLLGGGKNPRYNSRDSVWWFLQNIQDYTKIVPNGMDILQEKVRRRFFPYDDTWFAHTDERAYSKSSTIEDVIQEALQRHASGIEFREYDAGPNIDRQMKSEGFDIKIWTDWETGLIFGGNQWNCGTWMDKMGESEKAGNKGVPGTPRDGAPVEIIGMLYSTVRWCANMYAAGQFQYEGVKLDDGKTITYKEWADLIKANFERCFYVPHSAEEDANYDVNPSIINRRGIYKDLYRSGKEYEDYQLRPNFPVMLVVAPDLCKPEHALHALQMADKVLLGPQGMKTLDPSDLNYRGYYINSEDSTDFHTSKGRNYHQGPEWVWPTGFFLRAMLKFDLQRRKTPEERIESYQQVTRRLAGCMKAIQESPWAGLTELTQKDGDFCGDSCPTQSWSASCIIDLFQDAREYEMAGSNGVSK
ncbi:glycoside hydrolase family 13 protein [Bipolaris maydis]|nr:glycoside hydrolase family 13 protein [Bipolaris maydis]